MTDVTYIVRTKGDRLRFLADALGCVETQSRASRAVVVVDMKRGERRDELVRALSVAWPCCSVVVADAVGFAGAYNAGLEAVSTPYVGVLDADVIYKHHAATLAGELDSLPGFGVAYAYVRTFRLDPETSAPIEAEADLGAPFSRHELVEQSRIPVHAAIVRTAVARTEPWLSEDGPCCDWGYWLRLARRGIAFRHVPSLVGEYHVRNDHHSSGASSDEMKRSAASVRDRWGRAA